MNIMNTKSCSTCKQVHNITNFYKASKQTDGLRSNCKDCCNKGRTDYRNRHRETEREYNTNYLRTYYRDKLSKNRLDDTYYNKYRDVVNKRNRERCIEDPVYKIKKCLQSTMCKFFKKDNVRTFDIIGCTSDIFKSWMQYQLGFMDPDIYNIETHGIKWHVDHTIPCALFNLETPDSQMSCYNWSNLRPLDGLENIVKGDKIYHNAIFLQQIRFKGFEIRNKELLTNSIDKKYRIDRVLTTKLLQECGNGRGNDLGYSNNVKNWMIRSQASYLLEFKEVLIKLNELMELIKTVFDKFKILIEDEGSETRR